MEAVTGRRVFYYGELRQMIYAENLITAYNARGNSDKWAEWAESNPDAVAMLVEAEKLCR